MSENETSSPRPRAVVLSRDAEFVARVRKTCGDDVDAIAVPSGYQAAAEILDAGAAVLVVDFRSLGKAHVRLLDVARSRGVELLCVGAIPAGITAANLNRVRLATEEDVAGALAGVLPRQPRARQAEDDRPLTLAQRRARKQRRAARKKARQVPERLAGAPAELDLEHGSLKPPVPIFPDRRHAAHDAQGEYASAEGGQAKRKAQPDEPRAAQGDAPDAAGAAKPAPATGEAGAPRSLLTPEELAALLEDRP